MEIPKEVESIVEKLEKANFEAFLVGGCVRDWLRDVEPEDWDIATNAEPKKLLKLFPKSFMDNKFATVKVLTSAKNPKLKEVEITTYRIDEKYTDKRHPDKISFARTIEEDLSRRDFTVNAIALQIKKDPDFVGIKGRKKSQRLKIIDPYEGREDLDKKIIKTVGVPEDRFSEDALRMIRAVRFACTLNFKIESDTFEAIKKNSPWIKAISKERIRDEFLKIIMSDKASEGVELLRESGLLKHIIPELEENWKVGQNKHHIYDCWEHAILSLKYAAKKNFNKYVRLASLFHDIGKPRAKRGEGPDATFYNHEIIGTKMTFQILQRLKFPRKDIEKISKLVRYHLFYYNVDEVSEASVRRLVRNAGIENMEELLQVRMADRIGSGVPKAEPYKLRHLKYVIEKVSQDPISVKKLKVGGEEVMDILKISASPKVGQVLDILLGLVLVDPEKNKKEFLEKEIKKLGKLSDKELERLAKGARTERQKIETKKDEMTKKKYWVF